MHYQKIQIFKHKKYFYYILSTTKKDSMLLQISFHKFIKNKCQKNNNNNNNTPYFITTDIKTLLIYLPCIYLCIFYIRRLCIFSMFYKPFYNYYLNPIMNPI